MVTVKDFKHLFCTLLSAISFAKQELKLKSSGLVMTHLFDNIY